MYRFTSFLVFFLIVNFSQAQCVISNLHVEQTPCHNGKFGVSINFTQTGGSGVVRIVGNGHNYGTFNIQNLPILIDNLSGDCTTNYEFAVSDVEFPTCAAFTNIGQVCCQSDCDIHFTDFDYGDCDGSNYTISFGVHNSNEDVIGYDLYTNGTFHSFIPKSQLPITIDDFPSSNFESYNTIVICANDTPDCCDTISIVNPCICTLRDLRYQIVNCNEESETFNVRINFKHSLTSDSFIIGGNMIEAQKFGYNQLPITLDSLPFGDSIEYDLLIVDVDDAFCFINVPIGVVQECNFECNISDVHVEPMDCVDGSRYVLLSFNNDNPSLEGFTVRGNGHNYGNFQYGEDAYTVGPINLDCDIEAEFVIIDLYNDNCRESIHLEDPLCCEDAPCHLNELVVTENCEEDVLQSFTINFNHMNTSDSFVIRINTKLIGRFAYNQLPITIDQFNFDLPNVVIRVFDSNQESCNIIREYHFNCLPQHDCDISNLLVTPGNCNDNGLFYARITFTSTQSQNQQFIVYVNEVPFDTLFYGHNVYEVGPLEGNCNTIYRFLLRDLTNHDCAEDFRFLEPICCDEECEISEIRVDYSNCENGKYNLHINFDYANTTSSNFRLRLDGSLYGIFPFANLPVTVTGLTASQSHSILVFDADNEACRRERNIPIRECTSATNDWIEKSTSVSYSSFGVQLQLHENWLNGNMSIFNTVGQQLNSSKINDTNPIISSNSLPSGVYLVQLTKNDTRKLIKIHLMP